MPKKDLDRWCKGKEGVEHTLDVVLESPVSRYAQCHVVGTQWICVHSVVCNVCKRVLSSPWQMKKEECPTYMGTLK